MTTKKATVKSTKPKESRMESLYAKLEQEQGTVLPSGLSEGTVIELLNAERKKSLYLLTELDEEATEYRKRTVSRIIEVAGEQLISEANNAIAGAMMELVDACDETEKTGCNYKSIWDVLPEYLLEPFTNEVIRRIKATQQD